MFITILALLLEKGGYHRGQDEEGGDVNEDEEEEEDGEMVVVISRRHVTLSDWQARPHMSACLMQNPDTAHHHLPWSLDD